MPAERGRLTTSLRSSNREREKGGGNSSLDQCACWLHGRTHSASIGQCLVQLSGQCHRGQRKPVTLAQPPDSPQVQGCLGLANYFWRHRRLRIQNRVDAMTCITLQPMSTSDGEEDSSPDKPLVPPPPPPLEVSTKRHDNGSTPATTTSSSSGTTTSEPEPLVNSEECHLSLQVRLSLLLHKHT